MRKIAIMGAVALATAIASPATGQSQKSEGLVNVTVGDVILNDILNDNEIEALNDLDVLNDNQIIAQVPIGVAANVCNISAAALAKQAADAAPCTAQSGSNALAQAIRKQHLRKN